MKGLILSVYILMGLDCFAQGIGLEAGASLNQMDIHVNGDKAETGFRPGPRVGIIKEEPLSNRFTTQYGVFYNAKGSTMDYTKTKVDDHGTITRQSIKGYIRADYIEVPFSVLFHTNNNRKNGFFIGGGGYLAAAFGGLLSIENNYTHVNGITYTVNNNYLVQACIGETEEDDFSLLDAGLHIQGGYELNNGFYAKLYYARGLADIDPSSNMSMKNQNMGVTVGYMFRK